MFLLKIRVEIPSPVFPSLAEPDVQINNESGYFYSVSLFE